MLLIAKLEKNFELSYKVQGLIKEKLQNHKILFTKRLSLCISMMMISVVP